MSINIVDEYDAFGTESGYPPDPQVAAGPDYTVHACNGPIAVFEKSSLDKIASWTLKDFFSDHIPDPNNTNVFDPQLTFDIHDNRYLLSYSAKNESAKEGFWLLAVSADAYPFTWYTVRVDALPDEEDGEPLWPDFPKMGYDTNSVYLTGNMYDFRSDLREIHEDTQLALVTKSGFYQNNDPTVYQFQGFKGPDGEFDANTMNPVYKLTSEPIGESYMVAAGSVVEGDRIKIWKVDFSHLLPVILSANVTVNPFSLAPDARQPEIDDELRNTFTQLLEAVYANGDLWTTMSLSFDFDGTGDAESLVAYYKLDPLSATVQYQSAFGVEDNYLCYPSLAVHPGKEEVVLVYNRTARKDGSLSGINPGIGSAHLLPDGTIKDFQEIKRGESPYNRNSSSNLERFGDYSGVSLNLEEFSDGILPSVHYWLTAEYADNPDNLAIHTVRGTKIYPI